jgi:hypothetical protein
MKSNGERGFMDHIGDPDFNQSLTPKAPKTVTFNKEVEIKEIPNCKVNEYICAEPRLGVYAQALKRSISIKRKHNFQQWKAQEKAHALQNAGKLKIEEEAQSGVSKSADAQEKAHARGNAAAEEAKGLPQNTDLGVFPSAPAKSPGLLGRTSENIKYFGSGLRSVGGGVFSIVKGSGSLVLEGGKTGIKDGVSFGDDLLGGVSGKVIGGLVGIAFGAISAGAFGIGGALVSGASIGVGVLLAAVIIASFLIYEAVSEPCYALGALYDLTQGNQAA